ncbi:MAG: hypothetical protein AABZ47_13105, partial [Planctomycetota bacterium]
RSAGSFRVHSGARFDFKGGTILEDGHGVIVDNGLVKVWPQATAPAKFTLRHGSVEFEGNVAVGQTLVVQGVGGFGGGGAYAEVNLDPGVIFTNNGTIILDSILGPFEAELIVGDFGLDGMMVNNGTLFSVPGTGGSRALRTELLDNFGSIVVDAAMNLASSNGLVRNHGLIVVNPGGDLSVVGDSQAFDQVAGAIQAQPDATFVLSGVGFGDLPQFIFSGGAIEQGTVAIRNGTLTLEPSAVGRGHFTLWRGCELDGEIGPSHTVIVEGSNRGGADAYLTTPTGGNLTNRGTLIVATPDALFGASIQLNQGWSLVNEVGAAFEVNAGAGTNPFIGAALRNKGVTNVRRSLTLGNNNDTHQNQTTGEFNLSNNAVVTFQGNAATPFTNAADAQSKGVVGGIGQLNVGAGRIFQNAGRVEPGGDAAAGTLSVTGNYTQTSGGILNIELGGTGQGQFDTLSVSQQVTLSGTLNVTLLPGYTPQAGNSFTGVTFAGRTGDFATVNLPTLTGGLVLQRSYTPTAMVLTVATTLPDQALPPHKPNRRPIRR